MWLSLESPDKLVNNILMSVMSSLKQKTKTKQKKNSDLNPNFFCMNKAEKKKRKKN